jgi:hypothetical protein
VNKQEKILKIEAELRRFSELEKKLSVLIKKQEDDANEMFDDFFGVSKLYSVIDLEVKKIDETIGFIFPELANDNIFEYYYYEAKDMKDGGLVQTAKGSYIIKTAKDVVHYVEKESL